MYELPMNVPDVPISVTLTYEGGDSVTIAVAGSDPPLKGIVWGQGIPELYEAGVDVQFAPEMPAWMARTQQATTRSVCRWVNGTVVCS